MIDGKLLVTGGSSIGGRAMFTAELYEPSNGTWTATVEMAGALSLHTATLLPGGMVLAVGDLPQVYDPAAGTWTPVAPMIEARVEHTATLLSDGRVLVVGGRFANVGLASAELFGAGE